MGGGGQGNRQDERALAHAIHTGGIVKGFASKDRVTLDLM